ncbi:MAG: TRAP transporter fused permease subunit, partial [Peptococcaceae bacterium]|jgi:TRAP transporter 4TM/12TM fusion protein|nr:TRAP transporter fused permease subunit [Peptococcaceae bacterium]
LFVVFGGVLNATGGGKFFIDATYSMAGRLSGGTAKTGVMASALMGMISGSPIANVVTTGTFTIPLMKRGGFSANMSAAICAIASAGGILMPPVMGAAAFIMAEYLSMSYGEVVLCAIIPSVLFYASIFIVVDLVAVKQGLKGEDKANLPQLKKVMAFGWHLLIPIAALIVFLMMKWSASKAVFWSIVMLVVVSTFKKGTRLNKDKIVKALLDGAKESVPIAVACAAAGLIVGTLSLTGLGVKFSSSIIALSGGSKILALLMAMVASLILGMGMPATAVYILSASLLAPPLIRLGILPVAAHFFIFYFSVISCITPPVALTAYAAAGLAGTDPNKAGWTAFYYGILAYIIPFIFVYDPVLLWQGEGIQIFLAFVTAFIGIFGIGIALEGYIDRPVGIPWRIVFFVCGIMAVIPNLILSLVGIGIMAALIWQSKTRGKKERAGG